MEVPLKCYPRRGVNPAGTIVSSPNSFQPTLMDAHSVEGTVVGAGAVTDG